MPTTAEDDVIAFIRSTLEMFAAHDGFTAGIWHRERVAGVIGTHRIDWRNRRVELGYWLAREFEGRGIITDACRVGHHASVPRDGFEPRGDPLRRR